MRVTFLILLALVIAGCGERDAQEVSLAALVAAQQDFDGRRVIVNGTLRTFDEPRHYWIENDKPDRVALTGAGDLSARVGEDIEVHGRFHYDRQKGRRVEVSKVEVSKVEVSKVEVSKIERKS